MQRPTMSDGPEGSLLDIITCEIERLADMTDEEKLAYLHEVDARCPVSENLLNATPINVKLA